MQLIFYYFSMIIVLLSLNELDGRFLLAPFLHLYFFGITIQQIFLMVIWHVVIQQHNFFSCLQT